MDFNTALQKDFELRCRKRTYEECIDTLGRYSREGGQSERELFLDDGRKVTEELIDQSLQELREKLHELDTELDALKEAQFEKKTLKKRASLRKK